MPESFENQLITTADGSATLRHAVHGESYHSSHGAQFEANKLYMEQSGIIAALRCPQEALSVLDVGLGLGYNACTTMERWWEAASPPQLGLVSLEIDRELFAALRSGEAAWQTGWPGSWRSWVQMLHEDSEAGVWTMKLEHPRLGTQLEWTVYLGDAWEHAQPIEKQRQWDFIWQDPFSPRHNPMLWSSGWFTLLHRGSKPSARLLTYSVSRQVRDALTASHWSWEKLLCPGPKRNWLRATPEA